MGNVGKTRWFRIGASWLFDSQRRIGYKVIDKNPVIIQKGKLVEVKSYEMYKDEIAKAGRSQRVMRSKDPDKLDIEVAYQVADDGSSTKQIAVPAGVIRKSVEILNRQAALNQ